MEKNLLFKLAFEDDDISSVMPMINTSNSLLENSWLKVYKEFQNIKNNKINLTKWHDTLTVDLTDFHLHFKMDQSTMERLINIVGQHMNPVDYAETPVQQQVLLTVWKLTKGDSFIAIGEKFSLPASTTQNCFSTVVAVLAMLISTYIKWPKKTDLENISDDFTCSYGIPGVIGVIESFQIPIMPPNDNANDFFNRKKFHSVILQLVCDNRNRFIDVCIGVPGRVRIARAFRNSPLCKKAISYNLIPTENHIIGSTDFPLSKFLMVPFKSNSNLTSDEIMYNQKLFLFQSEIHDMFNLLSDKFTIIRYLEMSNITLIKNTIASVCFLHNFILMEESCGVHNNGNSNLNKQIEINNYINYTNTISHDIGKGQEKRNFIVEYLCNKNFI